MIFKGQAQKRLPRLGPCISLSVKWSSFYINSYTNCWIFRNERQVQFALYTYKLLVLMYFIYMYILILVHIHIYKLIVGLCMYRGFRVHARASINRLVRLTSVNINSPMLPGIIGEFVLPLRCMGLCALHVQCTHVYHSDKLYIYHIFPCVWSHYLWSFNSIRKIYLKIFYS